LVLTLKQAMKHLIPLLFLSIVMSSCKTNLDIDTIIDLNSSFTLTTWKFDTVKGQSISDTGLAPY